MKRRGVTGKLVTVGHLAEMLGGVSRQTALSHSQRWEDFPEPIDVLHPEGKRPMAVWWRDEVEAWIAANPEAVRKK